MFGSLSPNKLFSEALTLEAPWTITDVKFSKEGGKLEIFLDFPRGSTFSCPN